MSDNFERREDTQKDQRKQRTGRWPPFFVFPFFTCVSLHSRSKEWISQLPPLFGRHSVVHRSLREREKDLLWYLVKKYTRKLKERRGERERKKHFRCAAVAKIKNYLDAPSLRKAFTSSRDRPHGTAGRDERQRTSERINPMIHLTLGHLSLSTCYIFIHFLRVTFITTHFYALFLLYSIPVRRPRSGFIWSFFAFSTSLFTFTLAPRKSDYQHVAFLSLLAAVCTVFLSLCLSLSIALRRSIVWRVHLYVLWSH